MKVEFGTARTTLQMVISATAILCFATVPCRAVDPAPLPKQIKTAKTVYILNQGAENSILDNVYDRFRKWPRWTLTEEQGEANLLVVLSAQNYFYGMVNTGTTTTGTATATTIGNTTVVQGSARTQSTSVPILSYPRYPTLVDPKTGNALLTVSCELRLSKGYTAKVLIDRLKQRFPKNER